MGEKKSYYAIIPANVRYDKNLSANAKLLYGEITALCNEKGYCWATNEYFASLYNTSEKTITRWISNLKDSEYIDTKIEVFRYEDGTVKKIRYIFLDKNVLNQTDIFSINHTDKNVLNQLDKNVPYNNTSINNTTNNNIKKERKNKTSYDEIINSKIDNQEIKDLLYEFIKMRTMKKRPLTDRALTIQINKLFKLSSNVEEQKEIIEKSIVKCWDEFYSLKREINNEINRTSIARDGSEYSMYD
jgi:hypothetical protein